MANPNRQPLLSAGTLLLALAHLVAPWSGEAQAVPERGVLRGAVVDQVTGNPIGGALVRVPQAEKSSITDGNGNFVVDQLDNGAYTMVVEMVGYARREEPFRIEGGQSTQVWVPLAGDAIELDPITVTVRSRNLERAGFYRREEGRVSGFRLDRAGIEEREPQVVADLLYEAPGIEVIPLGFGAVEIRSRRVRGAGGNRGLVDIYVNGQRAIQTDLVELSVEVLEAVEVYRGNSVPPEYGGQGAVVLLWTR
ncbi:MAG: TonB-dependent receptor [Gemmatimonadota bacterium]